MKLANDVTYRRYVSASSIAKGSSILTDAE